MFNWLSEQYLKLIQNYEILLRNPVQCGTVELLRLFSITLLIVFLFRLVAHCIVYYRIRRFGRYNETENARLIQIYRFAAQKAGVTRLPPLYQFPDKSPLAFTIGCWNPSIFLAPSVINHLKDDELEAALVHELIHLKRKDSFLVWFLEIFFVSIPLLIVQVFALSFVFSVENSVYAILGALTSLIVFKAFLWERIIFLRELSCDDLSVSAIRDPLVLASSIIHVWQLSTKVSTHRWTRSLSFAQDFLPVARPSMVIRVRRLLYYKKPRLKFLIGKVFRTAIIIILLLIALFLWTFYSKNVQATEAPLVVCFGAKV
ncbi:M48 family metalloprotease [bacterium]|nr:M48 family metalloprotease [bacterium]